MGNTSLDFQSIAASKASLPLEYRQRIDDCECAIHAHEMRKGVFTKAKNWNYFSLALDMGCILCGGWLISETCRLADEELSWMYSVTGNPFVRRIFTPFPFFSCLLVFAGLLFLPADAASLMATNSAIAYENAAIDRYEFTAKDAITRGAEGTSNTK